MTKRSTTRVLADTARSQRDIDERDRFFDWMGPHLRADLERVASAEGRSARTTCRLALRRYIAEFDRAQRATEEE